MALPIRPGQGLPTNRPATPAAAEDSRLPSLPSLPEIPEVSTPEPKAPAPQKTVRPKAQATPEAPTRSREPDATAKLGPEWQIDPKTGKAYKRIAGYKDGVMKSRAAITNVGKRGATLEQLRMMVEDEPDFNLDDLNGSAETFLAHLRVPPNKEEQKKLLEERAARQKQFDEQAARAAADEEREFDS